MSKWALKSNVVYIVVYTVHFKTTKYLYLYYIFVISLYTYAIGMPYWKHFIEYILFLLLRRSENTIITLIYFSLMMLTRYCYNKYITLCIYFIFKQIHFLLYSYDTIVTPWINFLFVYHKRSHLLLYNIPRHIWGICFWYVALLICCPT